jgi:DnaJ-domain-containing protein 1
MTGREGARLQAIAELLRDARLAELRRLAESQAATRAALADLASVPAETRLSAPAALRAELAWQAWADARRAELNRTLARQTAEVEAARETAARAFGRAEALRGVLARMARGQVS